LLRSTTQPGLIAEAAGVTYSQFTISEGVSLENDPPGRHRRQHCTLVDGATDTHDSDGRRSLPPSGRGKYAAITRNTYGRGEVTYVGFMPLDALTEKVVEDTSSAPVFGMAAAGINITPEVI
jgi:beta-galactosidase